MDESASTDMPHHALGSVIARLAFRSKDDGTGRPDAWQTDKDAQAGATGTASEPDGGKQKGADAAPSPWAFVTRRTNSQRMRQLVLPPSHYAQPPIALFATGDTAAALGHADDRVDNDDGNDDDDDDLHVYEEIAALRSMARASARSHRSLRRTPHHAVRGGSGSGSGGVSGSGGRPAPFPQTPPVGAPVGAPAVLPRDMRMAMHMSSEPELEMAAAMRARMGLPFPASLQAGRSAYMVGSSAAASGLSNTASTIAAATFPSNRTLGGRVERPEAGRFRRPVLMRQHRAPAALAAARLMVEGAGSNRRPARRATLALQPRLVLATILALPGFDFGSDAEPTSGAAAAEEDGTAASAGADADLTAAATQLARAVLGHPAVVRQCGRAPHRRGVARFLVLLLTFPLVAHHGKAVFEQACGGYTPGDEHRPAFWAQYAAGFAAWLGLVDSGGSGGGGGFDSDPFLGGQVLQTLVMRLGQGRRRYLAMREQQQQQPQQQQQRAESLLPPSLSSSHAGGSGSVPDTTGDGDMGGTMGVNEDDDLDAAASTVNDSTDLPALVARLRQAHRNTQRLPVSKAVDAWLLFVERRRSEDLDPALLAELSLD